MPLFKLGKYFFYVLEPQTSSEHSSNSMPINEDDGRGNTIDDAEIESDSSDEDYCMMPSELVDGIERCFLV